MLVLVVNIYSSIKRNIERLTSQFIIHHHIRKQPEFVLQKHV